MNCNFTKHKQLKFLSLSLVFLALLFNAPYSQAKHILIYGDSLSAAYGMDQDQGWVSLLSTELSNPLSSGLISEHTISNASISGETSAGGLARLPLTLKALSPDIVFIALGANDGLRGYSTQQLSNNLQKMIALIKEQGATPIIAGISIPPSYGPRYIDKFRAIFPILS